MYKTYAMLPQNYRIYQNPADERISFQRQGFLRGVPSGHRSEDNKGSFRALPPLEERSRSQLIKYLCALCGDPSVEQEGKDKIYGTGDNEINSAIDDDSTAEKS